MSSSTEQEIHISVGVKTDRGRTREYNEDSYHVFTTTVRSEDDSSNVVQAQVAVVADGIGGAEGGKKASTIAIKTIRETINARALSYPVSKVLDEAIMRANHAINEARTNPRLENMGTTVVAAIIAHERLYVSHAGDSRAYLIRQGRIHRLTMDHTWVEEAVAAGQLTPEMAAVHPNKNVVKRYLGMNERLIVDHQIIDVTQDANRPAIMRPWLELQESDVVMLCTDGLSDLARDQEILRVVKKHKHNPQKTADKLIDLANKNGGTDNITAVVMAWKDKAALLAPLLQAPVIAGLLIVLLLCGALSWSLFGGTVDENSLAAAKGTPTTVAEAESDTSIAVAATATQATNVGAGYTPEPSHTQPPTHTVPPGQPTSTPVSTFTPVSNATQPTQVQPTQVQTTQVSPTQVPPTQVPPTQVPQTQVPPTQVQPTQVQRTSVQPTSVQPTSVPPPPVPPTQARPTEVLPAQLSATPLPPTQAPPTQVPPTQAPPTQAPPTQAPPTQAPPTQAPPTARNVSIALLSPAPNEFLRTNEVRFRVQVNGMADDDRLQLKTGLDQQVSFLEGLTLASEGSGIYSTNMNYRPGNAGFGKDYYWTVTVIGADGTEHASGAPRKFRWEDPNSSSGGDTGGDTRGGSEGNATGP